MCTFIGTEGIQDVARLSKLLCHLNLQLKVQFVSLNFGVLFVVVQPYHRSGGLLADDKQNIQLGMNSGKMSEDIERDLTVIDLRMNEHVPMPGVHVASGYLLLVLGSISGQQQQNL